MILSIITIVYNDLTGLTRTVESVQPYSKEKYIEYIVIDGDSTDGSKEYLQNLEFIDILISEKDNGIYDAMNKGIEVASGSYLIFMNSGDYFLNNLNFKEIFSKNSYPDIILGQVIRFDHNGNYIFKQVRREPITKILFRVSPPCHQAMFIRKYLFKQIGLYDLQYRLCADNFWYIQYLNWSKGTESIKITDFPTTYYNIDGLSNSKRGLVIQERFKMILELEIPIYWKILLFSGLSWYFVKYILIKLYSKKCI